MPVELRVRAQPLSLDLTMSKQVLSANAPVVVIVDDDQEDVYPLKRAILSYRKDVICDSVSSGEELFEYLDCSGEYENKVVNQAPRVILMDVNMPLQNGIDVLKQLRKDPNHCCLSVIMFTTSDSEDDIRKACEAGANSYIRKPVNASDMRNIAEKMCDYWIDVPLVIGAC